MRALSIHQPDAEAIMRGVKPIEFRSGPTNVRGRIHIYASLGRYPDDEEAEMLEMYGIDDVACDDLPRGVLIGTVELRDCSGVGGVFHDAKDFRGAVLRAMNLGDDADTTGAVCGQLAGAYWGESGIPTEWRDGLARSEMIEKALRGLLGRKE